MDYSFFIYLALSIGLWHFNDKVIVPRLVEPYLAEPYDAYEKCSPILGSVNGIGFTLCGGYGRYDGLTGSSVYYLFFSFFIPLIPLKCYRARELDGSGRQRQYRIFGHESWRFGEIVVVYVSAIAWLGGALSVLAIFLQWLD